MGKQVNEILNGICEGLGYIKKREFYIKQISPNIYSTLFFNIASYRIKYHRLVAPNIGIRYDNVEKLLLEISSKERLKKLKIPDTLSEHIGYIMPIHTWKEWDFIEPGTNSEVIINDLRNTLQKYSIEYCERFQEIDKVIDEIKSRTWNPFNYRCYLRLPILYYFSGHKQEGIDFINRAFQEGFSEADILFTDEYISNYMRLPDNPEDIK